MLSEHTTEEKLIYKNKQGSIEIGGKIIIDEATGNILIEISGYTEKADEFKKELEKLLEKYFV